MKGWFVWDRLGESAVQPTLTVGARYDTMSPEDMERMSRLVRRGRCLYCPHGSRLAMWDDQKVFMDGVLGFIEDVEAGRFR